MSENTENNETKIKKSTRKKGRPPISDDIKEAINSLDFNFDFEKKTLSNRERKYKRDIAETLLIMGFTAYEIEKSIGISHVTLLKWKSELNATQKQKLTETVLNDINENTAHFVNSTLVSLSRIALHCSTPDYLNKHDPAQVADLFDTIGNQTFKLIESNQRAQIAKLEVQARQPRLPQYNQPQIKPQESQSVEETLELDLSTQKEGETND